MLRLGTLLTIAAFVQSYSPISVSASVTRRDVLVSSLFSLGLSKRSNDPLDGGLDFADGFASVKRRNKGAYSLYYRLYNDDKQDFKLPLVVCHGGP